MAALTEPTPLRHRGKPSQIAYAVADGVTVYPGGIVALDAAGRLIPFAAASGTRVAGIMNDGDAKTGDAAGSVLASVMVCGALLEQVTCTGVTGEANVGDGAAFTTDNPNDATTTLPASGAEAEIVRFYSGTLVDLWVKPYTEITVRP